MPDMTALDVSRTVQDYVYGPTGNLTDRTNGGTNTAGGVSVVNVDDTNRLAPAATGGTGT